MQTLRYLSIFTTLLGISLSCNWFSEERSQKVLSPEKMRAALLRIQLIESSKRFLKKDHHFRDSLSFSLERAYKNVYEKLSITSENMEHSHRYYAKKPSKYLEILESVSDSIEALQSKTP